jgi:malate dehydrogenase
MAGVMDMERLQYRRMLDVAIIGAGELGGSLAQLLAAREVVRDVRLIDEAGRVAAGKALDLMQSAAVAGFSTRITGASELTAAAGAAVIVLADRVEGGEWHGEDGLLLLKRLAHLGPSPVILCAGATHRDLVERGVREIGLSRNRLLGSAPEALGAAVRAIVALETNGSPQEIALAVLGVPPTHVVIPWEEATIRGFAATRVLDEQARRRTMARIDRLWPPGPRALAAAARQAIAAMLGGARHTVSAFVAPDDSSGRRSRAAALPVRLGADGIERVELPSLSAHDQVALDNATLL